MIGNALRLRGAGLRSDHAHESSRYALHQRSEVEVAANPQDLFALLDDHARLARHMERPSLMTAGCRLSRRDRRSARKGAGISDSDVGAVLGVGLSVEEVVTEYRPPFSKAWETRGVTWLLVVGDYRMGFTIVPGNRGSLLTVFIDYRLPERGVAWLLGRLFGKSYARWCTRRMVEDAVSSFGIAEYPA